MYSVSRADGLCLAALLCLDLNVWSWWQDRHHPSRVTPVEVASNDSAEPPLTPPTAAPTESALVTDSDESDQPKPYLRWQHTYGEYWTVVTGSGADSEKLQIFQQGQLVFETENHSIFDPEQQEEASDSAPLPPPLTDLTGEHLPCLVVDSYSGGAHCCSQLDIFQLGPEFKHLGSIDTAHSGAKFVDLDGDGIPEVQLNDWSYAYVFTSFGGSPAPEKILRYQDGQYVSTPELLFTDPPTEQEFKEMVSVIKAAYAAPPDGSDDLMPPNIWGGSAILWERMLELTYKGHLDLAMKLYEQCWHDNWPDKDKALDHFWDAVGKGDYGRAVVQAQGYDLPEPEPEKEDTTWPMTTPAGDSTVTAAMTPEDPQATFHIVDFNESKLATIAQKYNVNVETLAEANGIKPDAQIHYGMRLVIPEQ